MAIASVDAAKAQSRSVVDDDHGRVLEALRALLAAFPPEETEEVDFLAAQFDAGLAWVHFPAGSGGLGLSPDHQRTIHRCIRAAGGPSAFRRNPVGLGQGAGTIVAHGTDAQRRRFLRPIFTGEEIWCQLFSEPGAGSDLAALSTSAVRDGESWVVNGQKVWTSFAHVARWGLLLARTDPAAPKHRGLGLFVVDMHSPGVEVRPLRQMTGDAEFNEVFLTDVVVSDELRIGPETKGWHTATTTLMNERYLGSESGRRGGGPIQEVLKAWEATRDPARRDDVARAWITSEVHRLMGMRAHEMRRRGTPGPEGSVLKLSVSQLHARLYNLCVDLMGAAGLLYGSYEMQRPTELGAERHDVPRAFLRSRGHTIEGGTSEVLRNILAERVLGLPREQSVDQANSGGRS